MDKMAEAYISLAALPAPDKAAEMPFPSSLRRSTKLFDKVLCLTLNSGLSVHSWPSLCDGQCRTRLFVRCGGGAADVAFLQSSSQQLCPWPSVILAQGVFDDMTFCLKLWMSQCLCGR